MNTFGNKVDVEISGEVVRKAVDAVSYEFSWKVKNGDATLQYTGEMKFLKETELQELNADVTGYFAISDGGQPILVGSPELPLAKFREVKNFYRANSHASTDLHKSSPHMLPVK